MVLTVILTVTLLLTSLTFAGGGKKEVIPAQMILDASLSEVSTTFDTPKANLEVARSREFIFGHDKFLLSSIVDKKSQQAYMVSTDAQGKVWIAKPKIEGELIDRMSQMKPGETVTVGIWAMYFSPEEELRQIPSKYPDVPFDEDYYPALGADVSPEVLDAIDADIEEINLRANEEAVQPVVDFLRSTGSTILYVSKYAPTVDAELSKEDIYKLARLPEVESISLPPGESELFMSQAHVNIRAEGVWAEGYNGGMSDGSSGYTQTRVAVVDEGVDFGHENLAHANGGTFQNRTPVGWHGTAVAGCIASNHFWNTGIAPGTLILDANCYDPNPLTKWALAKDATEWALQAGADVISLSRGFCEDGSYVNDYCKYFDHVAYVHHILPVCSVGNERYIDEDCEDSKQTYVASPANAYNALAVGGIDDQGDLNWNNDKIYWMQNEECPGLGGCCQNADYEGYTMEGSSGGNPVDGREKPEVCAPAVNIMTTLGGPDYPDHVFREATGTSFAAPQVAGIAAMLIEKDSMLRYRPSVLKAIIMASAIHNVVEPTKVIDDFEGVGTVDAYAAYECVKKGNYASIGRSNDDPFEMIQFYAQAGQKVRFVINVRAHTPQDGFQDYGFWSDFDFMIYYIPMPQWIRFYSPLSKYDDTNPWEIIEFTAPISGTYKARIWAERFDYYYDTVAAAWYIW